MSRTTAAPTDPPAPAPAPDVDAALERLKRLFPRQVDLSLDRMERLLAALGNPQLRVPPVVHVAGTNGKGSTIAFLRAMLEAAGYRVHAYTSPHLIRFNERIRLAGTLIGDDHLATVLAHCEAANAGAPITFFEITTCAAFLAFAAVPADILLLEVGLGGRLDSTNVIAAPAITAITQIAIDHEGFLGCDLRSIAGEKAGILKAGVPAVIAPQHPEAMAAIAGRAAATGSPLYRCGHEWSITAAAKGLRYESARRSILLSAPPALLGDHQRSNAGVAIACLDHLPEFAVDAAAIAAGWHRAAWPGRLQRLDRGDLVARLPPDWDLWLDGGHNPGAGAVLAAVVSAWRRSDPARSLHLVFGMLNDKDPHGFLMPLAGLTDTVTAVPIPADPKGLPEALLQRLALPAEPRTAVAGGVAEAIDRIVHDVRGRGRILVCGSLALVGSLLAQSGVRIA